MVRRASRLPQYFSMLLDVGWMSWLHCPDDWDSYGGATPTDASIQAAGELLRLLQIRLEALNGQWANPSHISPLPVGGVQLEWDGLRKDLEVEVGPDGHLAYLLVDRTGAERQYREDDAVPAATVIELLVDVLHT
jgi:hypothetical protein